MDRKSKQLKQCNKTRHGQVAGQSTKTLDQEFIMNNFSTLSFSDQLNGNMPQLPPEACLPEDLGSDACPWLDEYVNFSRKWSPQSFDGYHEACGLSVLSTVAAGRVVFDLSGQRKTNLNIMLVGRTSIHAKSTASIIAKDLLGEAGLDWLLAPDEITPQKLIEDMSSNELPDNFESLSDQEQLKAIYCTLTAGQWSWFIDEFGDKITAMDQPNGVLSGIKGLIRTLDGAPLSYENRTISRGGNLIKNPYLPILGNITVADLVPYVKSGNTLRRDGFFARFAMVTPPCDNLLFGKFPNEQRIFPDSLISPLVNWNELLGFPEYKITESKGRHVLIIQPMSPKHLKLSEEVFEAFYKYHNALRIMIWKNQNNDIDGNYARFPEKALRIAALFASFENGDSIELNHWAKAQAIAERWRIGLHELYQQVTTSIETPTNKFVNGLPIEDQITRAIGRNLMPDMRKLCQFTGLKKDIVEHALEKLISDGIVQAINKGNRTLFMLL